MALMNGEAGKAGWDVFKTIAAAALIGGFVWLWDTTATINTIVVEIENQQANYNEFRSEQYARHREITEHLGRVDAKLPEIDRARDRLNAFEQSLQAQITLLQGFQATFSTAISSLSSDVREVKTELRFLVRQFAQEGGPAGRPPFPSLNLTPGGVPADGNSTSPLRLVPIKDQGNQTTKE